MLYSPYIEVAIAPVASFLFGDLGEHGALWSCFT